MLAIAYFIRTTEEAIKSLFKPTIDRIKSFFGKLEEPIEEDDIEPTDLW